MPKARMKLLVLTFFPAIVLLIVPQVNGIDEQSQRPLCVSQLALANYACGRLPPTPRTLASSGIMHPEDHGHGHGHDHQHRHRHDGGSHDSPTENCCRWLNDLDDECVCDLLIRLPPFLARPVHQYTVVIGDTCHVSYSCNGKSRR